MTNENDKKEKDKKEKLIDHDFDGIKELDNPIPLWFNLIFFGTIIFSAGYLLYYQVYKGGNSLKEDFIAQSQNNQNSGNKGNSVDYAQLVSNQETIKLGKETYATNCASCHGMSGEGGVGPNLADDSWIVDTTYAAVEKVIDEGVPSKGMPAWKSILGDKKIQAMVAYISTLQGTNPANAKKPEGDHKGKLR